MGRSPHSPGDYPNIGLPSNVVTQDSTLPIATKPTNVPGDSTGIPSLPPQSGVRRGIKRIAGKENSAPNIPRSVNRSKLTPRTAHVGDHSITATDVSAQIIADGIYATQTGQECDILKQYIDTFLGPVPGFQLNIATGAYDINLEVATLESPGRSWAVVNFLSHANLPRPNRRLVQYIRIIGSRNIKDSDFDIDIPEVYQHGVVVPSKIGERVTNILPWARRSFESMARISLKGLERFDNTVWYKRNILFSTAH